jgi:CheY-like chemotaxis protein
MAVRPGHEPVGRPGARGARVLLAEDDADLRRVLALALRRAGYEVLEAGDGAAALALARAARPDVAVLDGRLPGGSGPAVARALAADPATAGVPVVLATGAPPPAGGPAAVPGVVAYLEKPFARAALLARVAEALARPRPRGRAAGAGDPPRPYRAAARGPARRGKTS